MFFLVELGFFIFFKAKYIAFLRKKDYLCSEIM